MNQTRTPHQLYLEGQSAYRAKSFTSAAQYFVAAEIGYRAAGNELLAAEMANNASVAHLQAGDAQSAFLAVVGTEAIFTTAGDQHKAAMALGNQGAALEDLGDLELAAQNYTQSAELLKELGEHDLRASVLQSLSALQLRTGRSLQALATMQAGVDNLEKPNLKQRLLKRLLKVPFRLLNR